MQHYSLFPTFSRCWVGCNSRNFLLHWFKVLFHKKMDFSKYSASYIYSLCPSRHQVWHDTENHKMTKYILRPKRQIKPYLKPNFCAYLTFLVLLDESIFHQKSAPSRIPLNGKCRGQRIAIKIITCVRFCKHSILNGIV